MFADVGELHDQIVARDERAFVSRYLFDSIPHIFGNDLDKWITWKTELGAQIDVDPRDIVITGSAAIGYSLNPTKTFRKFHDKSDVDCGVVSTHYFDLAWRFLRQRRVSWLTLPQPVKDAINLHRDNYVFSGTIAADQILHLLPFGAPWQKALDNMAKVNPTVGREIKLRIYKDFDCLRSYQSIGIRQAKSRVAREKHVEDYEIPTEDK